MWITLAAIALLIVLIGYVWLRQKRHPLTPGRRLDPDAQVQEKGSFWGSSPGLF